MGLLHLATSFRGNRNATSTADSGSVAVKHRSMIRRRSGFELAGGFLCITLLVVAGAALRDNQASTTAASSPALGSSATPSGSTMSGDTSAASQASLDPVTSSSAPNNDTDGTADMSVNVTTTTGGDGTTSSQMSVNGHDVTPPQNGATTHVYSSPGGQQTTITTTTSNNQTGHSSNGGSNFSSNNLHLNSSSFSNNFQVKEN